MYVGINGKKIQYIGKETRHTGKKEIDGTGFVLTPGFFDAHAHLDEVPFLEPNFTFQINQGITSIVTGICGVSAAPTRMDKNSNHYSYLLLDRVTEWFKDPPTTFKHYYDYLDKTKFAVNTIPMLGHSNVRDLLVGNVNVTFNETMMQKARDMVEEAMQAGAFGLTAGLMYYPSGYADVHEMAELCKVVNKYGGIFMNHMRSESDYFIEAVEETLEIGRQSGCPVQIRHMKTCGERNLNKSYKAIRMIDEARAKGQDVTVDQYPYLMANTDLTAILPPWA
ncbi:hypothetical protein TVAG_034790 [Trichomonas vaginalis G3]|uniref:Uncharacterized protein n=1 Tax=Trichomonas vaginalis (strain ATCC PRA-98 / G3) TaxID=412133 RepID=A2DAF3_TRIV3|nr:amidohydrolase family [Trichomonas vaginalis G3]EAY22456.1 hypothetical protein TVAG_034790 [Trichomonas vaginalis G3]KAI5497180.1 amidohydrolase family [Trichomonas vaginalis G3]|eukprot:XP_001583442.1 hypothetical protein [Trichomonas vaginalis G3]